MFEGEVLGNQTIQTLQRTKNKKKRSIISHSLRKEGAFWLEFVREQKI